MVEYSGNLADDGTKRSINDDSSQDSRQPGAGPAVRFEHLIVPDGAPVSGDNPNGEIIDIAPIDGDDETA